jgi:hypothetical protein
MVGVDALCASFVFVLRRRSIESGFGRTLGRMPTVSEAEAIMQ